MKETRTRVMWPTTADGRTFKQRVNIPARFHQVPSSTTIYGNNANPIPAFMKTTEFSWSHPPTNLVLSENDVHLWFSSLDLPASSLQQLETTLDTDERERAKGFCSERERARFVVGRGLLRKILGQYSGAGPSDLRFSYGSRGKPSLIECLGGDRIQFSLAHSNRYAIYAFTLDRRIGVDLECVEPIESEEIANRFFSDREKAALHALAGNERLETFFKIWTAKEAYLKACGEGLAHPLNKIETRIDPRDMRSLRIQGDMQKNSSWSLEQLRPISGFTAALVVEGDDYHLANWRCPEQ